MKKLLFSLLAAFVLLCATPAQAGIEFGVEAGMNMSKVKLHNFSDNFDSNNRYGWYFGPKLNISALGLGGDVALVYNQKRLSISQDDDDYGRTLRSIELPINVRYTLGLGSLASIYFATGPQFGWNVGNKKWSAFEDGVNSVKTTFKRKNANVSWNIGAGVKLAGHVEVGLGYNFALTKYAKVIEWTGADVTADADQDYDFKANTFQIQVAYLF